jgi:hypothetical protein
MKIYHPLPRSACLAVAFIAAAGVSLRAQVAPQASNDSSLEKTSRKGELLTEEVITMSPFIVNPEENKGYIATSTLAGTRLRTDLKDIGSSISVVTEQFLKDTGSRNSEDLLVYTVNTEVGGASGNFAGLGNGQQLSETNTLMQPQQNTRVRGLTSADNTRNYFLTDIPWDGYNIDRVEIQRGPNSILYGMGSPAGIINAGLKGASLKNENTIEARYGSFGSYRGSADFNRVLLPHELTLRVEGVWDKTFYRQDPSFNRDKRSYAAVRFDPKLFNSGSAHTTIRANIEDGSILSNRPRVLPPEDNISAWFTKLNKQTYTPSSAWNYTGANTGQLLGTSPFYQPWLTGLGNNTSPTAYYDADGKMISGFRMPQSVQTFGRSSTGSIDGGIDGIPFQQPIGITSYSRYAIAAALPYSDLGQYKNTQVTDSTVFDYYNNLIDGNTKREWSDWTAFNASIDQTFLNNRLGVQATVDHQDFTTGQSMLIGNPQISIDLNAYYTDGTANPNVGKPYISGSGQYGNNSYNSIRNSVRVTGFAEVRGTDFIRSEWLSKLFGRHVFTGLYSHEDTKTESRAWEQYAADSAYGNLIGTANATSASRVINTVSYLGSSLLNSSSASGANLSAVNNITIPSTGTIRMFDSTWNASGVSPSASYVKYDGSTTTQSENPANYVGWTSNSIGILNANTGDINRLYTSGNKTRDVVESKAFIWQGFFWDGAIVPTVGLRKDTDRAYSVNATKDGTTGTVDMGNTSYALPKSANNEVSGNSTSWSVVLHTSKLFPHLIPSGMDFSPFYNRSDNFKPAAGRVDVLGNPIDSPNGATKDYGFTVSAFNDRLIFKVSRYETTVRNDSLTALNGALWEIGQMETWGWVFANIYKNSYGPDWQNHFSPWNGQSQEQATAIQNAAVKSFLANLPSDQFYTAWGISRNDTAWQTRTDSYSSPVGLTATGDTTSKGYEFEVTAQPLKNWSITANVAKTTAKNINIGGAVKSWVEARNAVFQGDAGDIRLWWGGSTTTVRSDWNANFMSVYKLVTLGEGGNVSELRPWRYNIVTNYNFTRGLLKDFNVGGGYRWEDKQVIGYALKTDTDGSSTFDLSRPYRGPTNDAVDLWVGYERTLKANLKWRIQFNVRNVFATKTLIPITCQPDGTPAAYRIPEPLTWGLTNTISF